MPQRARSWLAYARIRHSSGESDFTRAARQGEIVVAARDQVVRGGFLNDPAAFIDAMGELLQTSIDPATIGQYVDSAVAIKRDQMYRAVIQYPLVHGGTSGDPRGSILVPRLDLIRDLAARAFPAAGTLPVNMDTIPEDSTDPTKTKLPAVTCYAPAPTPTPIPSPTIEPSIEPSAEPTSDPTPEPSPTDKPEGGPPTPDPTDPPPDRSAEQPT